MTSVLILMNIKTHLIYKVIQQIIILAHSFFTMLNLLCIKKAK